MNVSIAYGYLQNILHVDESKHKREVEMLISYEYF